MKIRHFLIAIYAFHTLSGVANADQLSDMSVFQPAQGVVANIYVSQKKLIIETNNLAPLALANIKEGYLQKYPDQLYLLNDTNKDGTIEVATLKSVNTDTNEFCYSVFSYNSASLRYENSTALISCKKGEHFIGKAFANK